MEINREVVVKLLKREEVTQKEFVEFILAYLKHKGKPEPTSIQVQKMLQCFELGLFQIEDALQECSILYNLQLVTVNDSFGNVLKIDVYEL